MASHIKLKCYLGFAMLALSAGCASPTGRGEPTSPAKAAASRTLPTDAVGSVPTPAASPTVSQAAYRVAAEAPPSLHEADRLAPLPEGAAPRSSPQAPQPLHDAADAADPFGGQSELSVEQLVVEVQARNPSLQAASAAWRAAAELYPQVVSLDDPMLAGMISPSGAGMDDGGGWMVEGSQKVPWAGKRSLRGNAAQAEADAMKGDIGEVRLRLAETARTAFYDYYLARREMEVNASTRQLLTQFRQIAANKYQVGQATEQDVLQADVELASLESRRSELVRDEQVAIARINTLLHRTADHPLPPPPAKVALPDSLPGVEALERAAIQSRPDLYALHARIRAAEAAAALACREYYPDVNLVARYDGFMPEEMRPQVGVDVNLPIRYARRDAAAREASQRVAQRRAEYQDRLDQVRYEVRSAWSQVSQSRQVVRLYEEKILPAAQRSLESALANYTSGSLDFLRLLDTERQLNNQREMYYQAIAEHHRRLAELDRAAGQ